MIKKITLGALLALSSIAFAADEGGGSSGVARGDGGAGIGAAGGGGEVALKVALVEEHRSHVVAADMGDRTFMMQDSELTITCRVTGAAIAGATKYGKIKFTEAVDDLGTKLTPDEEKFSYFGQGDTFVDIHDLSWDRSGDDADGDKDDKAADDKDMKRPAKGVDIALHLNATARKATKIISVKGEMQILAGGEKKEVTVPKINSMIGKTIDDPSLKAAGLTVKVVKVSADDTPMVSLELKGSIDAIGEIKLTDASGEAQGGGTSWNDEKGRRVVDVYAQGGIDDATNMKIEVMVGQKAVKVPFELKDIELP